MVATQDQKLAAVVLVSGFYDFKKALSRLREIGKSNPYVAGMVADLERESGTTDEALRERSALLSVERIRTPLLILNGAKDDRTFPDQARALGERVAKTGTPAKVVIFPSAGHSIPMDDRRKEIAPFLKKYL